VGSLDTGAEYTVPWDSVFDVSIPAADLALVYSNPHDPRYSPKSRCLHDYFLALGWGPLHGGAQCHEALKADGVPKAAAGLLDALAVLFFQIINKAAAFGCRMVKQLSEQKAASSLDAYRIAARAIPSRACAKPHRLCGRVARKKAGAASTRKSPIESAEAAKRAATLLVGITTLGGIVTNAIRGSFGLTDRGFFK